MTTEDIEKVGIILDKLQEFETNQGLGTGAYASLEIHRSCWGRIRFSTNGKGFIGEVDFSNLNEAIKEADKLIKFKYKE